MASFEQEMENDAPGGGQMDRSQAPHARGNMPGTLSEENTDLFIDFCCVHKLEKKAEGRFL